MKVIGGIGWPSASLSRSSASKPTTFALRHIDQRLKMQLEAVVSQRVADAPFEPQALLDKLGIAHGRKRSWEDR